MLMNLVVAFLSVSLLATLSPSPSSSPAPSSFRSSFNRAFSLFRLFVPRSSLTSVVPAGFAFEISRRVARFEYATVVDSTCAAAQTRKQGADYQRQTFLDALQDGAERKALFLRAIHPPRMQHHVGGGFRYRGIEISTRIHR